MDELELEGAIMRSVRRRQFVSDISHFARVGWLMAAGATGVLVAVACIVWAAILVWNALHLV